MHSKVVGVVLCAASIVLCAASIVLCVVSMSIYYVYIYVLLIDRTSFRSQKISVVISIDISIDGGCGRSAAYTYYIIHTYTVKTVKQGTNSVLIVY